MRFLILGPLEVHGDDGAVTLGGIKPRAVLAVLLLHANEPVSAERLALALWGEDAPGGATKTVQVHVSRLRKALGDADMIATAPAGYCLRVRPDELDAAHFERLVEDGRRALAGAQPQRAATLLREALSLWRGPPLAELAFEPFAGAEVARLEEQRLAALEARVEADLAAGRQAELVAELQQLAAANPTRERLAAHLMLALYRCGRQADALQAYQDARRMLVAEIGVEPGPQLRELQEAILRQDVVLEPSAGVPELPPELDVATSPPLVGREDELAWLRRHWERSREGMGGLVMVAGERGAGKSRIAAELAGDAHRRGDAVLYANGRGPADTTLSVLHLVQNATRPTLLVVDDADAGGVDVLPQLDARAHLLSSLPVLGLVCCQDADALGGLRSDGVLTLKPLAEDAVRAIGSHYASSKAPAEIPADWLLEASGGLPRRVHEVASQWARREAARRVTAVAGRAETERAQLRTIQNELVGEVVELQEARERIRPHLEDEPPVVCPFKGLASYEVGDAEYFFGRERLVAELVARLVGAPLLAVVGPSGSGKSSVMRAGLLPALAGGVLPGSEDWGQVLLRPGGHPVRELAAARAGHDGERRVVLAVDQFEETFTVCADESQRAEFVSELVHAAQDPARRCVVVLALRADYYGRCATYPELADVLAANNVLVRSMQRDEQQRAVEGPCQRAGLHIEPELVEEIVADVAREPGGLPLLSTALLELWQRRDGRRLRYASYLQTGGVRGAVARLAEDAFAQLDAAQQAVARRVLMRLVGAGDGGAVERRRVALDELEIHQDEDVARVVALLTDRRLLTVDVGTVEVAHEALLREWPRLRAWIEQDRDGLRIQRGLSAAAQEWERLGRDDGTLLRGSRLIEALEWREVREPLLNELEREFLAASKAAREHERVTRRRRTRLGLGAGATVILATVAVAVAALFAAREGAIAASRDIAAQSAAAIDADPGLALALAREALERNDTTQAENALRQAVFADRARAVARASAAGAAYVAVPSPDGRSVVTAADDGTIRLWPLGRVHTSRTMTKYGTPAYGAAFTPNGRLVASVARDGEITMTPVAGGGRKDLPRLPDKEYGVSVDAASDQLVVGASAGGVWLIPTSARGRPSLLGRHPAGQSVTVVSFNRYGTKVVSGSQDDAYIWDVASGKSIALHAGPGVEGASFSLDGRRVATTAMDGRVRLWDVTTGAAVGPPLKVADQPLFSVRFSPNGRRVVTTSYDGVVRISDVTTGKLLSEMAGGSALYADYVPGSDTVVSAGGDGTLRTWTPLAVIALGGSGTAPSSTGPSFNRDHTRVVSGADDGAVHLWDLTTGVVRSLPGHSQLSIAGFTPDGRQILSVSQDSTVRRYDLNSEQSRKLPFPNFVKTTFAVSNAGRIAVAGQGSTIVVQDANAAKRLDLSNPDDMQVNALAFSPDGTRLASAGNGGIVSLWNLKTGRRERSFQADAAEVLDLSYSSDGTRLATAGADGTVRIYPVDGGRPVVLVGHTGQVNTARFNKRGDRIVSAGLDGTVRLWSTAGGQTLVVLHRDRVPGPHGAVADFSSDGRSVVSASAAGTLITPCEDGVCGSFSEVQRLANTRAARTLTTTERQRLVGSGH